MIDVRSFFIGFLTCLLIAGWLYFSTDLLKEKVILNNDELNRMADEKVKIKMDSLRTLSIDSLIRWSMSDHR